MLKKGKNGPMIKNKLTGLIALIVAIGIGGVMAFALVIIPQRLEKEALQEREALPRVVDNQLRFALNEWRIDAKLEAVPTGTETITICAVGDIMMHSPQFKAALQSDGSYDFNDTFEAIMPYISSADIAFGNLETTINTKEKGYYGYPRFRSPQEIVLALKNTGFDVLTTANNHSLDNYIFGIDNTNKTLDQYNIQHTGSYGSPKEREQLLMVEKEGVKIAVLAYTYGTNGMEGAFTSDELEYVVTYTHEWDEIQQDINKAKQADADIIIACVHWGNEYQRQPSSQQKAFADQLLHEGVDVIFGSHPHVLQPTQKIESADGMSDQFVIYSMGNFVSNQRDRYKDSGIIVNLDIIKDYDNNAVYVGEVSFVPTWVNKYYEHGELTYKILPVSEYVTDAPLNEFQRKLNQVWNDTTSLIGENHTYH